MSQSSVKLSPSDLAAMLCGRVCHDLISPISALTTALEVLDDEDNADMHDHAIDLIKLSARKASAQLQFLRLAFGSGSSAPSVVALEVLKTLTAGIYDDSKHEISWNSNVDGVDKTGARLILNMIMLSVSTVPLGGSLTININQGAQLDMSIVANGRKARIPEAVSLPLAGQSPEDGFDGKSIQSFYAMLMAREQGGRITVELNDDVTTLQAVLPVQAVQNAA